MKTKLHSPVLRIEIQDMQLPFIYQCLIKTIDFCFFIVTFIAALHLFLHKYFYF